MKLRQTAGETLLRALPLLRGAGCAAFTLAMVGGAHVHVRAARGRGAKGYDRWLRRWARGVLAIFGVRVVLGDPRPSPARGARLVVANHRSPLDIMVLLSLFGGRVLSRGDLARWPIVGAAARQAGTIFVDRESRASGARAARSIRRHLACGDTVTVFPEGTTYRGDEVRPFSGGAFVTVRGLEVELLPVGLAYPPGAEFWHEGFMAHVGRVATRPRTALGVCVGAGRKASGRPTEIATQMREEVQRLTHRARGLLGPGAPS